MTSAAMLLTLLLSGSDPADFFRIEVRDEQTGRGVPLVELETVNNVRYVTDSAGLIAMDEPSLNGREIYFHVRSHGYEFAKDGFGFRGRRLKVQPGQRAELKIKRINIAERLYRVTGADIYRDSVRLGEPVPIRQPLLNAQVYGSDSVMSALYRGRLYWFWGDTNRPSYPLGNFHTPGATSRLPSDGGLKPGVGVDLEYFTDETGFAKGTCRMPGDGPTWIDGLTVLTDATGREHLLAHYVKVKPPLSVYAHGLAEFDDEKREFRQRQELPMEAPLQPGGQAFPMREDGTDYIAFATAYPLVRVRATLDDYCDLSRYEGWSYYKPGAGDELDRDSSGKLITGWKRNVKPIKPDDEKKLLASGQLKPDEAYFRMTDAESGQAVSVHAGSVQWNEYRRRWVMIFCQHYGTSLLGETWYSEAPEVSGPWLTCRKIVTHEKYSFYNPRQHAVFDEEGGRIIYFEGTYTHTFSGNPVQTPRYDYNQIMYRLDLSDPRLAFPAAP